MMDIATVEEARTMMQRRGYQVGDYVLEDGNHFVGSIAYGAKRYPEFDGGLGLVRVNYNTKLEIEETLDMIRGQHHMQCGQCETPVLYQHVTDINHLILSNLSFKLDSDGSPAFEVQGQAGQIEAWDEYRAVAPGPDSELITKCPGCGLLLSESVREIEE